MRRELRPLQLCQSSEGPKSCQRGQGEVSLGKNSANLVGFCGLFRNCSTVRLEISLELKGPAMDFVQKRLRELGFTLNICTVE